MDVEMPDGTVIMDIPDGTSKDDIMLKWQGASNYDPRPRGELFSNEPTMAPAQPQGMSTAFIDSITGIPEAASSMFYPAMQGITAGFYDELVGAAGAINPFTDKGYSESRNDIRRATEESRNEAPIASMFVELGGSIVPAMKAAQIINSIRSAAIVGAGEGALYGYGTSNDALPDPADMAVSVALGAAGGAIGEVPRGTARLVKKLLNPKDDLGRVAKADDLNYPISLGDRLGSEGLKKIEGALSDYPLTSTPHADFKPRQSIINKEVLKNLGVDIPPSTISESTLKSAKEDISNTFKSWTNETNGAMHFNIDEGPFKEMSKKAGKGIIRDKSIQPYISNFLDEIDETPLNMPSFTAAKYFEFRKELSQKAASEMTSPTGSRRFANELFDMVDELDKQVGSQMTPKLNKELELARKQWLNYLAVNKGNALNTATGDINAKSLQTNLQNMDRTGYKTGTSSSLYEMLKMAQAFPPLANSQTATRSGIPNMAITTGMGGIAGGPIGLAASLALPITASTILNKANKMAKKGVQQKYKKHMPLDNLLNILLENNE